MWKKARGWRDTEVSRSGLVRNSRTGRILKPFKCSKRGYVAVKRWRVGGAWKNAPVHQLVCLAFHGARRGRDAAHLNGVPNDNRASNLRWMSRSANLLMRHQHGRPWDQSHRDASTGRYARKRG